MALAPGIGSAAAATGTGQVRIADSLGSSSSATAAGQPGMGLHAKPPAVGARHPRFRYFHDTAP
jgi:hypothetical protein